MEQEYTHIFFLGNYSRTYMMRHMLRKMIPCKVYFIEASEDREYEEKMNLAKQMREELEADLPPWVIKQSETIQIPFFDFEKSFSILAQILNEEKKQGREIFINANGGSVLVCMAALCAANITGARLLWIDPETWSLKYDAVGNTAGFRPEGIKAMRNIELPVDIALPSPEETAILSYLQRNGGCVRSTLGNIADTVGYDQLGKNIQKRSSAIVKLSHVLKSLRASELVTTQKVGRRSFEIALTTQKGATIANIASIMQDAR